MSSKLHVVSHTHWDREWYLPFETHRLRLVALMDLLLDIFSKDDSFKHFHMDGQMIPLMDYLEVRPDKLAELQDATRTGKMSLGPWYVLQDEFLTSGEANVRNMQYGLKLARKFGEPLKVGYLPDSFGNMSQMPQLLRGFGIDNAIFGRGLNPYNAELAKNPDALPGEVGYHSEVSWSSPDGSEVMGVFMANWYSNAMDIPTDIDAATAFLAQARDNSLRFATTRHLLMMNGCDHTPTRSDVGQVIEAVREHLADEIVHTDMASYIAALREDAKDLQKVCGELRSDYTEGWGTLADTLTARLYLKESNWRCQMLLERWAEPLSAFAALLGEKYPADQLWYAWAILMQNHPHDSICGCSCDEVHREMETRFAKSETVASLLRQNAAIAIGNHLDNSFAPTDAATVMVMNPTSGMRSGVVEIEVELPEGELPKAIEAIDEQGNILPAQLVSAEAGWNFQLPDDRFRVPYNCTRVVAEVALPEVPGMGYTSFALRPAENEPEVVDCGQILENEYLKVEISDTGLLTVTEKASGVSFNNLNLLQDGGDWGDEYIYRAPEKDQIITSADATSFEIAFSERSAIGSTALLQHVMEVPAYSNSKERLAETVPLVAISRLFLGEGARHLSVDLSISNQAGNHRLCTLFPTGLEASVCYADGQFDIIERNIKPWRNWKNPSNPQPQQAFIDVSDNDKGLCIANRGLPGYEVLRDGNNTIALPLLRAVEHLGDWGVFPTPEAQCMGTNRAQYAIIPHAGHIMDVGNCNAARLAWEYASPLWATQVKHFMYPHNERWTNNLAATKALVTVNPGWLALSTIKQAEERNSLIVRFYNPFTTDTEATISLCQPVKEAYTTDLDENRLERIQIVEGCAKIHAPAKKIVTVEITI